MRERSTNGGYKRVCDAADEYRTRKRHNCNVADYAAPLKAAEYFCHKINRAQRRTELQAYRTRHKVHGFVKYPP